MTNEEIGRRNAKRLSGAFGGAGERRGAKGSGECLKALIDRKNWNLESSNPRRQRRKNGWILKIAGSDLSTVLVPLVNLIN